MGRPIQKKYFGNANSPYDNEQTGGTSGLGGERVSSITISNSGTNYSQGTSITITAPQIAGGVQATISSAVTAAGNITASVLTGGSGYTAASLVVTTATSTTKSVSGDYTATTMTATSVTGIYLGMVIAGGATGEQGTVQTITGPTLGVYTITSNVKNNGTFTNQTLTFTDNGSGVVKAVVLSSNTANAISFKSFLLAKDGGLSALTDGDIKKQEASRRYLVANAQGTGQCKLVATDALTAGTMNIIATDGAGSTYFVTKLTAHKATLVNRTSTSTAKSITGAAVGWTLGSATGTVVTIANA